MPESNNQARFNTLEAHLGLKETLELAAHVRRTEYGIGDQSFTAYFNYATQALGSFPSESYHRLRQSPYFHAIEQAESVLMQTQKHRNLDLNNPADIQLVATFASPITAKRDSSFTSHLSSTDVREMLGILWTYESQIRGRVGEVYNDIVRRTQFLRDIPIGAFFGNSGLGGILDGAKGLFYSDLVSGFANANFNHFYAQLVDLSKQVYNKEAAVLQEGFRNGEFDPQSFIDTQIIGSFLMLAPQVSLRDKNLVAQENVKLANVAQEERLNQHINAEAEQSRAQAERILEELATLQQELESIHEQGLRQAKQHEFAQKITLARNVAQVAYYLGDLAGQGKIAADLFAVTSTTLDIMTHINTIANLGTSLAAGGALNFAVPFSGIALAGMGLIHHFATRGQENGLATALEAIMAALQTISKQIAKLTEMVGELRQENRALHARQERILLEQVDKILIELNNLQSYALMNDARLKLSLRTMEYGFESLQNLIKTLYLSKLENAIQQAKDHGPNMTASFYQARLSELHSISMYESLRQIGSSDDVTAPIESQIRSILDRPRVFSIRHLIALARNNNLPVPTVANDFPNPRMLIDGLNAYWSVRALANHPSFLASETNFIEQAQGKIKQVETFVTELRNPDLFLALKNQVEESLANFQQKLATQKKQALQARVDAFVEREKEKIRQAPAYRTWAGVECIEGTDAIKAEVLYERQIYDLVGLCRFEHKIYEEASHSAIGVLLNNLDTTYMETIRDQLISGNFSPEDLTITRTGSPDLSHGAIRNFPEQVIIRINSLFLAAELLGLGKLECKIIPPSISFGDSRTIDTLKESLFLSMLSGYKICDQYKYTGELWLMETGDPRYHLSYLGYDQKMFITQVTFSPLNGRAKIIYEHIPDGIKTFYAMAQQIWPNMQLPSTENSILSASSTPPKLVRDNGLIDMKQVHITESLWEAGLGEITAPMPIEPSMKTDLEQAIREWQNYVDPNPYLPQNRAQQDALNEARNLFLRDAVVYDAFVQLAFPQHYAELSYMFQALLPQATTCEPVNDPTPITDLACQTGNPLTALRTQWISHIAPRVSDFKMYLNDTHSIVTLMLNQSTHAPFYPGLADVSEMLGQKYYSLKYEEFQRSPHTSQTPKPQQSSSSTSSASATQRPLTLKFLGKTYPEILQLCCEQASPKPDDKSFCDRALATWKTTHPDDRAPPQTSTWEWVSAKFCNFFGAGAQATLSPSPSPTTSISPSSSARPTIRPSHAEL